MLRVIMDARGVRQQMVERDLISVGPVRDEPGKPVVDAEFAHLLQFEHRRGGERLADRPDAEAGVDRERYAGLDVSRAKRALEQHFAAPGHENDGSRSLFSHRGKEMLHLLGEWHHFPGAERARQAQAQDESNAQSGHELPHSGVAAQTDVEFHSLWVRCPEARFGLGWL